MRLILLFLLMCSPAFAGTTYNPYTGKFDKCVTIEEEDGSPSNVVCSTLKVENGSLTDNGDGTFSFSPSGGGGVSSGTVEIQVDGVQVSTNNPTLDFDGTNFTLTESPTDDFDITIDDDGHSHTGASLSGIDISDDTNLAGDTEIVLTDDTLSIASTIARDSELHNEVSLTGLNYLTLSAGQVLNVGTVDISDHTNLSGDSEIVLTGDSLSLASSVARDSELHSAVTLSGTGTYLTLVGQDIQVDPITESDISDLGTYLENIVEDTTPQLGGELDGQGNSIIDLGNVTFRTGAQGGTLRTGTSAADKFTLQAYDVDGGAYVTLMEADAGNSPIMQLFTDLFHFEDSADPTKILDIDISTATASTTTTLDVNSTISRTISLPDESGTLCSTGSVCTGYESETHASEHEISGNDQIHSIGDDADTTYIDMGTDGIMSFYRNSQLQMRFQDSVSQSDEQTLELEGGSSGIFNLEMAANDILKLRPNNVASDNVHFFVEDGYIQSGGNSSGEYFIGNRLKASSGDLTVQCNASFAPCAIGLSNGGSVSPGVLTVNLSGNLNSDGSAIFNETGADADFRVESDTHTDALFIDGADGSVTLGNLGTGGSAECVQADTNGVLSTTGAACGGGGSSEWTDTGTILHPNESTIDEIAIGGTTEVGADIFLGVDGFAVFNEQGNDVDFRIEGDTDQNLVYVDAGNDRVGIGTNTPSVELQVVGDAEVDGLFLGNNETIDFGSGAATISRNSATGDLEIDPVSGEVQIGTSSVPANMLVGNIGLGGTATSTLFWINFVQTTTAGRGALQFAYTYTGTGPTLNILSFMDYAGTGTIGNNMRAQTRDSSDPSLNDNARDHYVFESLFGSGTSTAYDPGDERVFISFYANDTQGQGSASSTGGDIYRTGIHINAFEDMSGTTDTDRQVGGFFDEPLAVGNDIRFYFESSSSGDKVTFGDTYMEYDSTDTDIEVTVDGTQVMDIDNDSIDIATPFTSSTNNLGWSVQTAANQACTTTCTSAAVFGQDTGTGNIVSATDATADRCVCAGAS